MKYKKLGWVDAELTKIGKQRAIRVFTRHYHAALQIAKKQKLIATLPSKAARLFKHDPDVVIKEPPFDIPPITKNGVECPTSPRRRSHLAAPLNQRCS